MLKSFVNKMNNCMLWTIVVPTAFFIATLSALVFSYASVIWHSNHITIEGAWGKITAAATLIQNQNIKAITYNQQLSETTNQLNQLLNNIKLNLNQTTTHFSADTSTQNKLLTISDSLKKQSELLANQKKELDIANKNLLRFQQELYKLQ